MASRVWNEDDVNSLSYQHMLLDQKLEIVFELLDSLTNSASQDDIRLLLLTAIEADEILLHHLGECSVLYLSILQHKSYYLSLYFSFSPPSFL